jgi:hypothetical protein
VQQPHQGLVAGCLVAVINGEQVHEALLHPGDRFSGERPNGRARPPGPIIRTLPPVRWWPDPDEGLFFVALHTKAGTFFSFFGALSLRPMRMSEARAAR